MNLIRERDRTPGRRAITCLANQSALPRSTIRVGVAFAAKSKADNNETLKHDCEGY